MSLNEPKVRPGSLIVEKAHIYADPNNLHSIESYGIVINIDENLGVKVYWTANNKTNFYPKELFKWYTNGTVSRFWKVYY